MDDNEVEVSSFRDGLNEQGVEHEADKQYGDVDHRDAEHHEIRCCFIEGAHAKKRCEGGDLPKHDDDAKEKGQCVGEADAFLFHCVDAIGDEDKWDAQQDEEKRACHECNDVDGVVPGKGRNEKQGCEYRNEQEDAVSKAPVVDDHGDDQDAPGDERDPKEWEIDIKMYVHVI